MKMPDRAKEIWSKVEEWWKAFTKKQQMIIVSSVLVVSLAIGILAYVLTRPEMVVIRNCESAKEAASVKELLDGAGIYNDVSDNGLVFTIKKKDQSAATILLGSNAIATDDPVLSDILSGSLSTTEADKSKLYKEHLEGKFENVLESLENVEKADVTLELPTDDGTLIAQQQEKSAAVFLTLDGEMDEEQAAGLAKMIATQLGNETTDNISIMDSNMTLLYAGGMDGSSMYSGVSYSQLSMQQKVESKVKNDLKKVILGTKDYQNVEVAVNLPTSTNQRKTTSKKYSVPEGRTEGFLSQDKTFSSESTSAGGGVPGTASNGEDGTYVLEDGNNSSEVVSDSTKNYLVDEEITEDTQGIGDIIYDSASVAITLIRNRKYEEDTLKKDGTLDDLSFAEYRAQIEAQEKQKLTVDPEMVTLVANATGVPEERITIMAYEEPVFIASSGGRTIADYLEILLAVLIFALLGFVVFMSTRKEKQPEMEPELSVETLLQTTKENQEESLEDIGFKEKSEARVLIEKFVDEKPEAVATLLRNWLNEDWD